MSQLPDGWTLTSLGAVADVNPAPAQHAERDELVSFVPMAAVEVGTGHLDASDQRPLSALAGKSYRSFAEGDILFAKITPCMENGKIAIASGLANGTGFGSTEFHVIRPHQGAHPRYLLHFLLHSKFRRDARRQMTGTAGQLRVPTRYLSEAAVPLPPFAEQERIVAAIQEEFSRIDAGIAELDSARARLDALLRAVERSATLGLLVPQDPDDEPAGELLKRAGVLREKAMREAGRAPLPVLAPDISKLPKLPSTWAWASLDEIAEVAGGVTKDQKKQGPAGTVEVPYLRVANVQRGRLDLRQVTTIRVPPQQANALRLLPGDILFNEGGDRDKLGRGWIWEGQIDNCVHQNHVFRARLYTDELDPRFVSTHGNAFGRLWFERMGKQTTNLASLNRTTLRSFPVPIPPAAEQQRIMNVLVAWTAAIRAATEHVDAQTRRSNLLRSTVLAVAFSGSLVPQDRRDEPAARLLERLAAERAPSNGHQMGRSRGPRTKVTA